MRVRWEFDPEDVQRVKALVDTHRDHPSVHDRISRNVERQGLTLSREVVWAEMVGCLVSTRQRWEKVERFLRTKPFPLSYNSCTQSASIRQLAESALEAARLRRWKRVAMELAENLDRLEKGLWDASLAVMKDLLALADPARERSAADFIDDHLVGFGPKQARNLLQGLGLTRYEIPLDSRIARWLTQSGFPVPLPAQALSDRRYYHFVSNAVQHLCAQCGVYPCVLDAVVFVSAEGEQ
jgi:hypothetical protein